MDWSTLLANPPDQAVVRYRSGLRKAPAGETLLVVGADGRLTLEHWKEAETRRFSSTLDRDRVLAVFGALATTGFPDVLAQTVPPGPGLVAVEVVSGPDQAHALLHRSFIRDLPAWTALVGTLDALCAEVSGGAIRPA